MKILKYINYTIFWENVIQTSQMKYQKCVLIFEKWMVIYFYFWKIPNLKHASSHCKKNTAKLLRNLLSFYALKMQAFFSWKFCMITVICAVKLAGFFAVKLQNTNIFKARFALNSQQKMLVIWFQKFSE